MTADSAPRPITNHAAMAGASRINQQPFPGPTLTSRRLLLRPDDGPATGAVDGAWWPRTANLTTRAPHTTTRPDRPDRIRLEQPRPRPTQDR